MKIVPAYLYKISYKIYGEIKLFLSSYFRMYDVPNLHTPVISCSLLSSHDYPPQKYKGTTAQLPGNLRSK